MESNCLFHPPLPKERRSTMNNKLALSSQIITSAHGEPADIVITNGKIVDVFNSTIITDQSIAITDGMIVGIGPYEGTKTIDAKGKYIVPGLIDAHVHIESSMMTPQHFSDALLPHGVTTAITDPHEIANVLGKQAIQFMIDESDKADLDIYTMLPSSVPSTPFETSGATLTANDLAHFNHHPKVLGLAEVMDYPAVMNRDDDMLNKLNMAKSAGKNIDGHASGLSSTALNVYRTAGILTDHECTTAEEALVRTQRGFYVMMREGSVAKDLLSLLPAVTAKNSRRFMFCTDDKHPDDLLKEGSIDFNIRLAIKNGLDPITAIQLATINAATCFNLKEKGAIAPGFEATFLFVNDLNNFTADEVFLRGKKIVKNGQLVISTENELTPPEQIVQTVKIPNLTENDFMIHMAGKTKAHVIGVQPNSLITDHLIKTVDKDSNGYFTPSLSKDQLTLAVIERHGKTSNIGLGIVTGIGLKKGAIATTIAHDSHNIIVVGTSTADILCAVRSIEQHQGGLTIVSEGVEIDTFPLPIGGLMSPLSVKEAAHHLTKLHETFTNSGSRTEFNPFLTLSFLALPVIPSLKLTDMGLFDTTKMAHIPIPAAES